MLLRCREAGAKSTCRSWLLPWQHDRRMAVLAWLEPALANRDDLSPDPLTVERELGRNSLSFGRARGVLERLWDELRSHSEVLLKRQLWDGLLREAYGTPVGDDALFLQHT